MESPSASGSRSAAFFASHPGRLLLLALVFVALQVPLAMIEGVVRERSSRRAEAQAALAQSWGGAQHIAGPLLRVTCLHRWQRTDDKGQRHEGINASELHLLPERLDIDTQLNASARRRGIFALPVYTATITLAGHFASPDPAHCPEQPATIDPARTQVLLGLADPRGLKAETGLDWNGTRLGLQPATGSSAGFLTSGVHAPLAALAAPFAGERGEFRLVLGLNGSGGLRFAPLGKDTSVRLRADWPHPSFQGGWLPQHSQIGAAGFEARWSLSWLGRDFPQVWTAPLAHEEAMQRALFGVDLVSPVDHYVMAERIAKYAVLSVLFTLLTVWLIEVLTGRAVHAVQYGFTGAAVCLFGLLQLALAEHAGFGLAYGVAAALIVVQVSLYSWSVLRSMRRALAVGGVLAGLYGYLYAVLGAEDYALLGGALALFALLCVTMFLTRRIDWGRPQLRTAP